MLLLLNFFKKIKNAVNPKHTYITLPAPKKVDKQALKTSTYEESVSPSDTCTICNKPVSDRVRLYCLSNTKFNGKIYCFKHQKTVN